MGTDLNLLLGQLMNYKDMSGHGRTVCVHVRGSVCVVSVKGSLSSALTNVEVD